MSDREAPFFIGWAAMPPGLRWFMGGIALGLILFLAGIAYVTAATQDDPGQGAFVGRANATGILQAEPYPILHVTESADFALGSALLLTGGGKRGVQGRAAGLDGALVAVSGARIARGDIAALQLRGGEAGLKALEQAAITPPAVQDLGRWRISGEICDGKCYAGAMRPGRGLAHKACANLCLIGGIPPVLVATDKIDGTEFFLLAGPDGGPVTDQILDHVGLLIELEGQVQRHGGMAVLRLDPETLKVIP
ncbi:MAG: hypothetical protein OIF40_06550 [Mangrovicoccus sp.]|nr:hypothetical protein [Mangrovicoccus sp.]